MAIRPTIAALRQRMSWRRTRLTITAISAINIPTIASVSMISASLFFERRRS